MTEYHFGFVLHCCRLIHGAAVFLAPPCRYCADYRCVSRQHDAMNIAHLANGAIDIGRYAAAATVQIIRSPHLWGYSYCTGLNVGVSRFPSAESGRLPIRSSRRRKA